MSRPTRSHLSLSTLRSRSFDRILLIKPSAVGDVIHTLPVLAKLRARYPHAQIDWLLAPAIAELVERHPALSRVVPFDRRAYSQFGRSLSTTRDLIVLLARLSRARYDLVIDLHGQFRSAALTLATRAPVRIGFARPRGARLAGTPRLPESAYRHGWTGAREGSWVAYTHQIPIPTLDVHAVNRYLWLGDMLGFDDAPPRFEIPIPAAAKKKIEDLLGHYGVCGKTLAVLVPGTTWETKHWRIEGFAEVGRHLHRTGRGVILAGTEKDRERCHAVAALCPHAVNMSGQTSLPQLAAMIQQAAICVTNDSGAMHLAVALDRPVVAVFGPTDPLWIGPYGRPHAVVRSTPACAPCYLRKLRKCPHDHLCMRETTAPRVIERLESLLAAVSAAAG